MRLTFSESIHQERYRKLWAISEWVALLYCIIYCE